MMNQDYVVKLREQIAQPFALKQLAGKLDQERSEMGIRTKGMGCQLSSSHYRPEDIIELTPSLHRPSHQSGLFFSH
jgi:hypothetical protein